MSKQLDKAELEKVNATIASLNNVANQVAMLEANKQAVMAQYAQLLTQKQNLWNGLLQKYKLDPKKTYNIDQRTGRIIQIPSNQLPTQ